MNIRTASYLYIPYNISRERLPAVRRSNWTDNAQDCNLYWVAKIQDSVTSTKFVPCDFGSRERITGEPHAQGHASARGMLSRGSLR